MYQRDHDVPVVDSTPSIVHPAEPGERAERVERPERGQSVESVGSADPAAAPGPVESVDLTTVTPRHSCVWSEVVEAVDGVVFLLNSDYVCVYASGQVLPWLGFEPEAAVGRRLESLLAPDQLPHVWQARASVAAGDQGVRIRLRGSAADGQDRWIDSSTSVVKDPTTGVEYIAVHGWDVTHELELQAALARSEQRHIGLLEAMDQAVLQLDSALRIVSFNQQALALTGCSPDRLLGRAGLGVLDLRDSDGRAVLDVSHPALGAAVAGLDDVWCTVACGEGRRTLVRARLATYPGARPEDGGHLLLLREAGGPGTAPAVPGRDQARGAAGLTAREGDVLDGLAAGGDVPTIARWLGISVHSVRGHVKSITAKLGVHSQLQAVIAASRRGMVDLSQEPRVPPGGSA